MIDSSRGSENWAELRYILKIGPIGFPDRLEVGWGPEREREREMPRMTPRFLAGSNWKLD